MPHGLLFDRVIHSESTKGFAYTFGKKTSPGFPTDGPRVPHPSGPGEVRAWEHHQKIDSDDSEIIRSSITELLWHG